MNSSEKMFFDLPPRVIIHDILSFHHVRAKYNNENEFDLFGYFQKDYSRHPWFLFSCVDLFPDIFIAVSLKRLEFLTVYCLRKRYFRNNAKKFFRRLLNEAPSMVRLHTLSLPRLGIVKGIEMDVGLLFSDPANFPALQNLKITSVGLEVKDTTPWTNSPELWSRMRSIHISSFECFCNRSLFKMDGFLSNVVVINFSNIKFPEEIYLQLPELQELSISRCQNMFIEPVRTHVRSISMDCVSPKAVERIFERCSMDKCSICMESQFSEVSFLRRGLRKVRKNIVIRELDGIEGYLPFSDTLEKLTLESCESFDPSILRQEFPCLEQLILYDLEFSMLSDDDSSTWKVCERVKHLSLDGVDGIPRFFMLNRFDCLETLTMREFEVLPDTKWNEMPKLKKLEIDNRFTIMPMGRTLENVFPKGGFPLLEKLLLSNYSYEKEKLMGIINQSNKEFENNICFEKCIGGTKFLKTCNFQIHGYDIITDAFFENCSWDSLQVFRMGGLRSITGKTLFQKGMMRNLEQLTLTLLPKFNDDFFQNSVSAPKLNLLRIHDLPLLTGSNWSFFLNNHPNVLKVLYFFVLPSFTDEILRNVDFPHLECMYIVHCAKFTGRDWRCFPKLNFLNVQGVGRQHALASSMIGGIMDFDIDTFFSEHPEIYENLEIIEVTHCRSFTSGGSSGKEHSYQVQDDQKGKDKVFKKLKRLKLEACENLCDLFFMNNSFPLLGDLSIFRCGQLVGKNWNKMERIRDVSFRVCGRMEDFIFQGDVFESVNNLNIGKCDKVVGKDWKFKPLLHSLEIESNRGCNIFLITQDMENENKPVPEHCEIQIQTVD